LNAQRLLSSRVFKPDVRGGARGRRHAFFVAFAAHQQHARIARAADTGRTPIRDAHARGSLATVPSKGRAQRVFFGIAGRVKCVDFTMAEHFGQTFVATRARSLDRRLIAANYSNASQKHLFDRGRRRAQVAFAVRVAPRSGIFPHGLRDGNKMPAVSIHRVLSMSQLCVGRRVKSSATALLKHLSGWALGLISGHGSSRYCSAARRYVFKSPKHACEAFF
jgi:hypothetical protein